MMWILIALLAVFVTVRVAANDGIDRTTVGSLDLPRYMGRWYEIARFDHRFERGLEAVEALYTLMPDDRIEVRNSGFDPSSGRRREAVGKAYAGKIPGTLRVSFFWFFYSDYLVLEMGDNYDWALVGSSSSRYLWILSRTPRLPSRTLGQILRLAERRGYNTGRLIYVTHAPMPQATEQAMFNASTRSAMAESSSRDTLSSVWHGVSRSSE